MNEEELKVQKQIEELEQQTENMTEEEYFRKTYPDSCYGDKPLSPYWDFFQDGVEFGERQSEKKVEDLENKIADIKANCDIAIEVRDLENNLEIKELKEADKNCKTRCGFYNQIDKR